ncbi:hypothetical protein V6Z11_D03G129700 [Gossypium hirsutum]
MYGKCHGKRNKMHEVGKKTFPSLDWSVVTSFNPTSGFTGTDFIPQLPLHGVHFVPLLINFREFINKMIDVSILCSRGSWWGGWNSSLPFVVAVVSMAVYLSLIFLHSQDLMMSSF